MQRMQRTFSTRISISWELAALAHRTLLNSTISSDSILIATGVEDVNGGPLVFFDFEEPSGNESRLYADPEQ